jgi:MraZ protein
VFTNRAIHILDGKGRLVLPAQYRRVLEGAESVVLAQKEDGCLMLLRVEDFQAAAEERRAEATTPRKRANFRFFMNHSDEVEIDKAGRLMINPEFRTWAGLELGTEVVIAGMYDHAEIWNRDRYGEMDRRAAARFLVTEEEEEEPPA